MTDTIAKPIGLLGGTFNPIHHGHLRLALELYERLNLDHVRLIPSANPPHREQPSVSSQLRLEMVEAAIAGVDALVADARELEREGPSYMVDTLSSLRTDFPNRSLCLILGMDAFMGLAKWYQWERLIELANLIVVHRPGKLLPMTKQMRKFLKRYQVYSRAELAQHCAGKIFMEEIPELMISSTQIRALIHQGKTPRYLLPIAVLQRIQHHQLYR